MNLAALATDGTLRAQAFRASDSARRTLQTMQRHAAEIDAEIDAKRFADARRRLRNLRRLCTRIDRIEERYPWLPSIREIADEAHGIMVDHAFHGLAIRELERETR